MQSESWEMLGFVLWRGVERGRGRRGQGVKEKVWRRDVCQDNGGEGGEVRRGSGCDSVSVSSTVVQCQYWYQCQCQYQYQFGISISVSVSVSVSALFCCPVSVLVSVPVSVSV